MKVTFGKRKSLRNIYPFDEANQFFISVKDKELLCTEDMREASIFYQKTVAFIEENGTIPANVQILHEYEIKQK